MATSPSSSAGFAQFKLEPDDIRGIAALLARWFRFQPSEIEELDVVRFVEWGEDAGEQIRREYKSD
ncbi:hypothetical protein B0E41_25435 [Hydrogenophaga sp. A37]|uniref:hypothetical protein n=1 Tax=Hydrogenophaga sp. A37 TaxID=1945864 RepID=UPI00098665E9|nr:hypothetical protein [Hydrogenophaga sp. A37]OOG79170.1 hypothetical protein B0E41_25435 [Hydrogenophaga sp. A37]